MNQPQDIISQMKGYLQSSGYTPPAPATPTGTGGWYDSVLTSRKQATDSSYGGFGGVAHDIGSDWGKRADEVGQILDSNQSLPSKVLQTFGKGFAAVGDTAGDVIKSAIKPEVMRAAGEKIAPIIEAAKQTPVGQGVINWWADLEQSDPELAKNLEATGNITNLLSYAIGMGGAKVGTEVGLQAAKDVLPGAISPLTEAATKTVQGLKDTAQGAKQTVKDSITGLGTKPFKDVYTSHAQSTKALGNTLDRTTINKNGRTITPIDTMESYQATPKVIPKSNGGHALDFTDVKAEAMANSKEANKAVDAQIADMMKLKPFAFSKKQVMSDALDAASKDKEIVRTASLPGVQTNIKQIFEDYGIKGDTITPDQINEFRKGANQASQAYYNAQRIAATAGSIPKDVADRAQAFTVLGDVFRENLVKFDPTLDTLLTTQRLHNAVQQYASRAHLSSVGISGQTRAMIDSAATAGGALVGTAIPVPGSTIMGAGVGFGLSEKAQNMLLKRLYEGAEKTPQSMSNGLPVSEVGTIEGSGDLTGSPPLQSIKRELPTNPIQANNKKVMTKSITKPPPKVKGGVPNPLNRGFIKIPLSNNDIPARQPFTGFKDLTTKVLTRLEGRTNVSKQYIYDLSNNVDLKQPERDLIRLMLKGEGETVNSKDFANKVKTELLPLKREAGGNMYENVTLPEELRGPISDYSDHIYSSPIKTSVGDVHFGARIGEDESSAGAKNYFAHTRIEDLPAGVDLPRGVSFTRSQIEAVGKTRRVIELQSDLFQKGRLEGERKIAPTNEFLKERMGIKDDVPKDRRAQAKAVAEAQARDAELSKLEPYRNTWQDRIIREEVKQAAKDGKTKLQFPTGETAMKIEGLGQQQHAWITKSGGNSPLTPDTLKVGEWVRDRNGNSDWIITDVLGDGKFKAVPKRQVDNAFKTFDRTVADAKRINPALVEKFGDKKPTYEELAKNLSAEFGESFDISGKVDTNNPIYRFYEKEVGRYLTNKYGAKVVTDPQGVKWYQIDIPKEAARLPIEAYGIGVGLGLEQNQQ